MNPQNTKDIFAATDKLVKGYEGATNQDADVLMPSKKFTQLQSATSEIKIFSRLLPTEPTTLSAKLIF